MVKSVSEKRAVTPPSDCGVEEAGGKNDAKSSGDTKAASEAKKVDASTKPLVDEVTGYEPSKQPAEKPMTTSVAGGARALEMAIKSGRYDGPEGLKKLQAEIGAEGGAQALQQMLGAQNGSVAKDGDGDGRIGDEPDPAVRAFLERNFGDFERSRDLATAGQDSLAKALEIARQRRGDAGAIPHSKRRQAKLQQKKDAQFFQRDFDNRYLYERLGDQAVEDRGIDDDMVANVDYDEAEMAAAEAERIAGEERAERDEMDREVARRSRSRRT